MKRILVINNKGGCGKSTLVISLADIIPDSQIVDLDNQKTLTSSAELTGRHVPISLEKATSQFIIIDTPPYRDSSLKGVIEHSDYIIIPVLIGYPDLLATKSIIDTLKELNALERSIIVYTKVRRPHNKSYFKIKEFFSINYPQIRIAKTELAELRSFQDALATPIYGKAKDQVETLIKEININLNTH